MPFMLGNSGEEQPLHGAKRRWPKPAVVKPRFWGMKTGWKMADIFFLEADEFEYILNNTEFGLSKRNEKLSPFGIRH